MQQREDGTFLFSPTDLVNFLGCSHATALTLRAFTEQQLKPDELTESDKLLHRKGELHETEYLKSLKGEGRRVAEIPKDVALADRARMTTEAMKKGADVVYQAALLGDNWGGFADFLIKVDSPSSFGAFSYEAADTKLARHAQAKHLIQLGVYSQLLSQKQGVLPRQSHVVLGDNTRFTSSVSDSISYVRHAMARLAAFAESPPADSYPAPCKHCSMCHWKGTCSAQWEADDHLCLVANMQRGHAGKLQRVGITTIAGLASLPADASVSDLNPDVFRRLRAQASLQNHKRTTNENRIEVLPVESGRGFCRLPKPDPGDIFFDMEGDPLQPGGLEYLFGVVTRSSDQPDFRAFWAHDHEEERKAFGDFMSYLSDHLASHPDAFIYHYNHYETTALKRLSGRYALAEHQLDDLLRRGKFVDLYKVVHESIRVSEPAYSLKNLETFYMPKREGDVATAGDSIVVYNRWRESGDSACLAQIAQYNEIDCISTGNLRDWLLTHRPKSETWFDGPSGNPDGDGASDKEASRQGREARYSDYQARLTAEPRTSENLHRFHLADLLEFHAREGRPQWWEFFDRQTRRDDELLEDAECLAGMSRDGEPETVKKSFVFTYRFPPQETKRRAGDQVYDVRTLIPAGTIESFDDQQSRVTLKRGTKAGDLPNPLTVGPGGPVNADALREAIYRVATSVLEGGKRYLAVQDILNKALPRFRTPPAPTPDLLVSITETLAQLDNSYFFIQGPPGAGKTHTSAHVIVELIRRGKKVGIAANSHKVIHTVLDKVEAMAAQAGVSFVGVKKCTAGNAESAYNGRLVSSEAKSENIRLDAALVAGTAWLFAHNRFDQHFDYLLIDEAGQVSIANVVAMGASAKNIILVGDQMQLGQPIQGVHPGEAGLSILDFLLGGQATVSSDRGLFLDNTRRLHPSVCDFISRAFYDGRLSPSEGNELRKLVFKQEISGINTEGIYFVPVAHSGCSQQSEEEGATINRYFQQLIGQTFEDRDGSRRTIGVADILVVSPYNVQVNYLKSVLPAGVRVGTVDKFQGQEAPIVLLSMATSDAECLPRDISFLFSANRLNVALSRAQCLAIVFASPALLEVPCRSIEQLKMVNRFCQLSENQL